MTKALLALVVFSWAASAEAQPRISAEKWKQAERLTVEVLAEHPHDPGAFTQGLLWHGGALYESTGQYGSSTLRRVDPATGTVLFQYDLDPGLFGEGLALVDGRLVMLTWQAGLALVFERQGFVPVDELTYTGEGWGLAWDGSRLVMSDGSSRLAFRDPHTFEVLSTVDVTLDGQPLGHLNELEVVDGRIWANVWQEDRIVRIHPETGKVTAVVDASPLRRALLRPRVDVLNGIAYDPESKTFWLTGKLWPSIFQVVFAPAADE